METDQTHLDEVRALALLHGEESPGLANAARHVDGCPECQALLDRLRREEDEIGNALERLDHRLPAVTAETIAALAGSTRHRRSWIGLAAAGLLAVAVGGAAYAIPGSPVRAWVDALLRSLAPQSGQPAVGGVDSLPAPRTDSPAGAGIGGIEIAPEAHLTVRFARWQDAGVVMIRLTDGDVVSVRAPAGAATFTTERQRLLIGNAGQSDFEIDIPRAAPSVDVWIAGVRVVVVASGIIRTGPPPDTDRRYRIPLARP